MSQSQLSISRLINVSVILSPTAAQAQSLKDLLILGTSTIIDTVERFRTYGSLEEVATDFGDTAAEYLAAKDWFAQVPKPNQLLIGRWAKTAAAGGLRCAPLTEAQQAMNNWTTITTGAFKFKRDAVAAVDITGLNFSGATNLQAVAAIIQAALPAGNLCVWNPTYDRFEFTSSTTGVNSVVDFLTSPATGSDISDNLAGRASDSGAYSFAGVAAEAALAAAQLFAANYGQKWYGLSMIGVPDNDAHLAVANFIEATDAKHLYFASTQEAGCLVSTDTTNLMYRTKQAGLNRTFVEYSSTDPYVAISAAGRLLTVDYNASQSSITLMYKQQPGVTPETLSTSQVNALKGFNGNVYVEYNNDAAILQYGTMASGIFADIIAFVDWFAVTLQTEYFNILYTTNTKVPQTDPGMNVFSTAAQRLCDKSVDNGSVAPGVWTNGGFGQLKTFDYMPNGYYIYAPSVDTQSIADRAARKSVPFQIGLKLAGAVHEVSVSAIVNQ